MPYILLTHTNLDTCESAKTPSCVFFNLFNLDMKVKYMCYQSLSHFMIR